MVALIVIITLDERGNLFSILVEKKRRLPLSSSADSTEKCCYNITLVLKIIDFSMQASILQKLSITTDLDAENLKNTNNIIIFFLMS